MSALHPAEIDLTLDRMQRLLASLGNPEAKVPPVVHVAGTNGKGSTVAMVRAGLEAMGQSVHVYTSPHLVTFHERIVLAGAQISEAKLCEVLEQTLDANGSEEITYFEATTAAAFLAFAETPADALILEVGLGGRLDATNVVTPRVSVITPVSFDHQEFLGDTVEKIATEKAGILKRGVPGVIARQEEAAEAEIESIAGRVGAPLQVRGQHWHVGEERGRLVYQDERGLLDLPLPALRGPHQVENAGTALAVLRELGASETACGEAMERADVPARMQRLGPWRSLDLWIDGGHNPAAGGALAQTLGSLPQADTTVAIIGIMARKDSRGFLARLLPSVAHVIAVPVPGVEGFLPEEVLRTEAKVLGGFASSAPSFEDALDRCAIQFPGARVILCGSLYLAGAMLTWWEKEDSAERAPLALSSSGR